MAERGASPHPTLPRPLPNPPPQAGEGRVGERGRVGRGAAVAKKFVVKRVLVVDVGGNSVKILASAHKVHRSFPSRPKMTPRDMLSGVKKLTADWAYDVVSIGYPGPVLHGRAVAEPYNLGRGWVGFDFARAFGCPVKVVNDAAMQALGSYRGGKMLFLGLGYGRGQKVPVVSGFLRGGRKKKS